MNKGLILVLVCFAGCGSLGDQYNNMVTTNQKMEENIDLLREVKETVLENQVQVKRSTREIHHLAEVNGENAEVIKKSMTMTFPSSIPKLAALGLVLLLLVPCFVLAISFFSLRRKK